MNIQRWLEAKRLGAVDPDHAARLHGGGKGAPPPAPDYRGAAQDTAQSSKEVTNMQTWANRPEINTPWGQQSWETESKIDPATGQAVTAWTQNTTLSPEQQAANDAQMRIQQGRSDAAETLLGQATGAFQKPFDWENMPAVPGSLSDAQTDAYKTMSAGLEPGRERARAGMDTKLANMGLTRGSEAFKRAQQDLSDQFSQQDKGIMSAAMAEGRAGVATQEQMRQQAIAEQGQRRGMTLNELNALLTGQQVSMPSMPGFNTAAASQATDYSGAAKAEGDYGLSATKLKNDAAAAQMQAMTSMAGSAASMF